MKKYLVSFGLAFALAFVVGCGTHKVTLEQATPTTAVGTFYTDPYLAETDQAILTASGTIDSFVQWEAANATFLAKYPQVHALSLNLQANKAAWERAAYAARDDYAAASKAYQAALAANTAGATPPSNAAVAAALSLLSSASSQISTFKALKP